jgi:replicative DNA helicase
MELDYQPPFDTRLELHILGAMISDPECIADVIEIVKPKYFYHRSHMRIYEKIIEAWSEDETSVDLQLIAPSLAEQNISLSSIVEAAHSVFSTADIEKYCERLKDLAMLRSAGKIGEELVKATTLREQDEIRAAISKAELNLARLNEATARTDTLLTMKEAVIRFHEQFEKVYYSSDGGVSGIPTGFRDLDAITSGLQRADLIIIGARPSMGKTTLGQQIALNVSLTPEGPGEPTAFFSLEQSARQLAGRAMANQSLIDLSKLNSGLISDDEWEKYTLAMSRLSEANLVIDEQPGLTVNEIKAKARKIKRERGLSLVLIDYLGKIRAPDPRMNRYEAVSENARLLKDMAKELDVPVICLAQLSRAVEQRQDKRPMMSDLRESGEIEQEADIIAFLYRDDYYNRDTERKNITELIIAKNRNGPIGTVELYFLKNFNRFVDVDRGHTHAEQMALV